MTKKIIVFSTVGITKIVLNDVDFTTFGEVKEAVLKQDRDINFSKLVAIEQSTRVQLRDDSILPDIPEITIFLAAANSDKAMASYKELRATYKEILSGEEGDEFKAFIGKYGNYTQFSTLKLQQVLDAYLDTDSFEEKLLDTNSSENTLESLIQRVEALEEAVFSGETTVEELREDGPSEEELIRQARELGLS